MQSIVRNSKQVIKSIFRFGSSAKEPLGIEAYNSLTPAQQQQQNAARTSNDVSVKYCLKSGLENPSSAIGLYAGDMESYSKFRPVFNYVIRKYHKYDPDQDTVRGIGAKLVFTKADEEVLANRVKSTRIRVARNLADFPFPSAMNKAQRLQVEKVVLAALRKLPSEFQGTYYPISGLSPQVYDKMVSKHLLFKAKDSYLQTAGIFNDWPAGRGAYIARNKNFMVWINEEDHMRIIYLAKGADFNRIYRGFTAGLNSLTSNLKFAEDPQLGYINSCPTNIGTAMRASMHIRLQNLPADKIQAIAKSFELQVRGTHGEHSAAVGGIHDISNARRLGLTREVLISDLVQGALKLVREESTKA